MEQIAAEYALPHYAHSRNTRITSHFTHPRVATASATRCTETR